MDLYLTVKAIHFVECEKHINCQLNTDLKGHTKTHLIRWKCRIDWNWDARNVLYEYWVQFVGKSITTRNPIDLVNALNCTNCCFSFN